MHNPCLVSIAATGANENVQSFCEVHLKRTRYSDLPDIHAKMKYKLHLTYACPGANLVPDSVGLLKPSGSLCSSSTLTSVQSTQRYS